MAHLPDHQEAPTAEDVSRSISPSGTCNPSTPTENGYSQRTSDTISRYSIIRKKSEIATILNVKWLLYLSRFSEVNSSRVQCPLGVVRCYDPNLSVRMPSMLLIAIIDTGRLSCSHLTGV